jgi:hypothetical protein
MAILRATVVMQKLSSKPEDAIRNVWHFATGGLPVVADFTSIDLGLKAFYTGISSLLGSAIDRNGANNRIEISQVNAGAAGPADDTASSLLATSFFTMANPAASAVNLPSEAAIAMSIRGDVTGLAEELNSGFLRPKSRKRGRVFLGPLNSSVVGNDPVTFRPKVNLATRDQILASYTNFKNELDGPGRIVHHVVYSTMNATTAPVVLTHVDDAFDTIRSRGEKAIDRSSQVVAQPPLVP